MEVFFKSKKFQQKTIPNLHRVIRRVKKWTISAIPNLQSSECWLGEVDTKKTGENVIKGHRE